MPDRIKTAKIVEFNFDVNRPARCGFPEFIYGEGKTLEQLIAAVCEIRKINHAVVITRLKKEFADKLSEKFPEGIYDERSRTFIIKSEKKNKFSGRITILTAGTCDIPVALEALHTLEACGYEAELICDVGVAGIERLFKRLSDLRKSSVVIVIAGMEGALPSVVAGLVSCPVIAVPSSVGYGASLNGLAALLAMLNSCASGVTVLNIDNGFGAACAAIRIINSMKLKNK